MTHHLKPTCYGRSARKPESPWMIALCILVIFLGCPTAWILWACILPR